MGRIRRLPADLVNQIAAGEVVERPASVVKELAENAIDAGATRVTVRLSRGGCALVTVIDDGCGMSRDDAATSLERHATSKLIDKDGLFHILTKGFRGEALPAIASVSRFSLVTSEPGAPSGTRVVVEGGGAPDIGEAPAVGGTRIDVADLFFNVPARRKFLKREQTELLHCEDAVTRLALAHPEVGFTLEHDERVLWSSPPSATEPKHRAAAVLGREAAPHLLAIDARRLGVTVSGFVASPEFTLANARGLMTFVNHRYVRDRGLTAAIQRAYRDSLPMGRQPVALVFIEVDPAAVDVNVHPQKLEVRFSDPRSVQEAVGAAVSEALAAAPWRKPLAGQPPGLAQAEYAQAVDRFLMRAQAPAAFLEAQAPLRADQPLGRPAFGTARPSLDGAPPPGFFSQLVFLGALSRRFWLAESPAGSLVILDPRAASERIALSALLTRHQRGLLALAPRTLFAARLALGPTERERLLAAAPALMAIGVEVEDFGPGSVSLIRVPPEVESLDPAEYLLEVACAKDDAARLSSLARHVGLAAAVNVTHDEARARLAALDEVVAQVHATATRVVVRDLPVLELERG
ncbi:MAG: DNA mismatch repair endonuclease MutL [Myxococcaceae bacterium]|nr:DNA mismatch repair endonuclease MutL [Myxococcaceae bacterium]